MIRYLGETYSDSYDPLLVNNRDENKMLDAAKIEIRDNLQIDKAFKVKLDGVEGYAYIIHQGNIAEFSSMDDPSLKVIENLGKIEAITTRELIRSMEEKRKQDQIKEQQKRNEEFAILEKERVKKRNIEKAKEYKENTAFLNSLNIKIKDYPKNPLEYIEKSMSLYLHSRVLKDLKELEGTHLQISNIEVDSMTELRKLTAVNILQKEVLKEQFLLVQEIGVYPDISLSEDDKLFKVQLKDSDGKIVSELSTPVSTLTKEHHVTALIEGNEEVRGSYDKEWEENIDVHSIQLEYDEHNVTIGGKDIEDLTYDFYESAIYKVYEHLFNDTVFYDTDYVTSEMSGRPSLHENNSYTRHIDIDLIDSKKENVTLSLIEHLKNSISLENDNGEDFKRQLKSEVFEITSKSNSNKLNEKPKK